MNKTTNYGLNLPEVNEFYDVEKVNENTQIIDEKLKEIADGASEFALQTAVDKIQSAVTSTLTTSGWYRVAQYNLQTYDYAFMNLSMDLIIATRWNATQNEYYKLNLIGSSRGYNIVCSANRTDMKLFSKARLTQDTNNKIVYFEVYYNSSSANPVRVTVNNLADTDNIHYWSAIKTTLTSETADGITVKATYDIPTNVTNATTADLANYLPRTGGTIDGATTITGKTTLLQEMHITHNGGSGVVGADDTHIRLTTIQDATDVATRRYMGVYNSGTKTLGEAVQLCDVISGKPTYYTLLHTGNKPTGTYTGNGSATTRTINTGGIGNVCYIGGGGVGTIATPYCSISFHVGSDDSRIITSWSTSELKFKDGVITMNSNTSYFNHSGTTFIWQVL